MANRLDDLEVNPPSWFQEMPAVSIIIILTIPTGVSFFSFSYAYLKATHYVILLKV